MNTPSATNLMTATLALVLVACSDGASKPAGEPLAESHEHLGASNSSTVLILSTTVTGGLSSREAFYAAAAGYTVEVATPSAWSAKSAADFSTYRAVILGDATCSALSSIDAAQTNLATWAPMINGNLIIMGSDPVFHQTAGGNAFTKGAVEFAAADPAKTGAYIGLSCYYHGVPVGTPVDILSAFGSFAVQGVPCTSVAHKVAEHPALNGITDTTLSGWNCSVHEAFDTFPATFLPLAIARVTGSPGTLTFPDGSFGVPYILARGRALVPIFCGNGRVEVGEECDDGNTANDDGCSAQCKIEVAACGDGKLDAGEQCDDDNTAKGDGCSPTCTIEPPPTCLTIRRGLYGDVHDTYLSDSEALNVYGTSTSLPIGHVGTGSRQILLSFGLGAIPPSALVTSAEIGLTEYTNTGIETLAVHAATVAWPELTTSYASFGGAFDPGVLATSSNVGPGAGGTSGPIAFSSASLTALVQGWVSGASAKDGVLIDVASGPGYTLFRSSEHTQINDRPRLKLCYIP